MGLYVTYLKNLFVESHGLLKKKNKTLKDKDNSVKQTNVFDQIIAPGCSES